MSNILSISAIELVEKLKSGEISCVDVCKEYIKRIDKFDKDVKAWAFFDKKLLLEKAQEKDEYRKSGKPLGPLHGLPIGIKDIIGTQDMPTECGTVLRKGMSESADAEVVNLLKISGAIIMGKTVTTEFAYFDPFDEGHLEFQAWVGFSGDDTTELGDDRVFVYGYDVERCVAYDR